MSEAPGSGHEKQNGKGHRAFDHDAAASDILSAATAHGGSWPDEVGQPRRGEGAAPSSAAEPDVGTAPPSLESPIVEPEPDAERLLSQAYVHAERLRVHAEAARGEAEFLRAEAAALRRAARDEAGAAIARSEALTTQVLATAEEVRSAIEEQAEATRAEIERLRVEASSLRRLLQAEIEAGLAKTQRMHDELEDRWADKLATEHRRLSAESSPPAAEKEPGAPAAEDGPAPGGATDPLGELRQAIAVEVEQRLAGVVAELEHRLASAPPQSEPGTDPVLGQLDVGRLLRDIWDAAEPSRVSDDPGWSGDTSPHDGAEERATATMPLIGSGGWCASTPLTSASAPGDEPAASETSPPPPAGRDRRRFRRPR